MKTKKIQRMIQNALLLALLILFTLIKFPLGAISFTMQLFIVFLIVQLTPFLDELSILFTYLLMGLIGIPVFSMGGGLSYIYQPSFGFMIGFIVLCPFVKLMDSILLKTKMNAYFRVFIGNFVGLLVDYLCGYIYAYCIFNFYLNQDFPFLKVFQLVIAPFILFDLLKVILAALVSQKIKKHLILTQTPSS